MQRSGRSWEPMDLLEDKWRRCKEEFFNQRSAWMLRLKGRVLNKRILATLLVFVKGTKYLMARILKLNVAQQLWATMWWRNLAVLCRQSMKAFFNIITTLHNIYPHPHILQVNQQFHTDIHDVLHVRKKVKLIWNNNNNNNIGFLYSVRIDPNCQANWWTMNFFQVM